MGSETWVLVPFIIIRISEFRKLKGTILLPPRTQLFTSQQAIDIALQSFGATRFSEAQGILLKVLDAEPEHSFANQLLGIIAYQLGDCENALNFFHQALKQNPNYSEAHNNLALTLLEMNRLPEAEQSCRKAIDLNPDYFEAHNNLGLILGALGRSDEAEQSYANSIRINETFPEPHNNMALLLIECGRKNESINHLQRYIELVPDDLLVCNNLASILIQLDRRDEAIEVLKEMCRMNPEDLHGQSLRLAYLGAAPPPKTQSSLYLNELYKQRSVKWDIKKDYSSYNSPDLVVEMASRITGGLAGLDVLDAGCGTGFIGDLINNECRRLVGVDLSPEMLAFAEAKVIYDQLECTDLIDYMKENPNTFDAILSAATIIHFGDLSPVFSAASIVLKEHGVFTFDIFPFEGETFGVNALMFYAHNEGYITSTATDAGFEVIAIERKVQEHNKSTGELVECLVVGLRLRPIK